MGWGREGIWVGVHGMWLESEKEEVEWDGGHVQAEYKSLWGRGWEGVKKRGWWEGILLAVVGLMSAVGGNGCGQYPHTALTINTFSLPTILCNFILVYRDKNNSSFYLIAILKQKMIIIYTK